MIINSNASKFGIAIALVSLPALFFLSRYSAHSSTSTESAPPSAPSTPQRSKVPPTTLKAPASLGEIPTTTPELSPTSSLEPSSIIPSITNLIAVEKIIEEPIKSQDSTPEQPKDNNLGGSNSSISKPETFNESPSVITQNSESIPIKVNHWLEISEMGGSVKYNSAQIDNRNAQIGDRLANVGDRIITGGRSQAALNLDNGLGMVNINANTQVKVQEFKTVKSGGRITKLQVDGGQVRLQVRSFTNPDSRLELITPAGVSGVRGTEFGVSVHPDGKMSVATLTGKVATTAEGQEVLVKTGFQNLTIKGESPLPATPLTNDTRLKLEEVKLEGKQVHIVGRVDAVNLLEIDSQMIATDRTGHFDIKIPVSSNYQLTSIVTTPLGKQQIYELAIP